MSRPLFLAALLVTSPVVAQGVMTSEEAPVVGTVEALDGGTPTSPNVPAIVDQPLDSAKGFYLASRDGEWALACMFLLFVVVGVLRTVGRKIHDLLPDHTVFDKPLYFLFDTKVGGWLLNWATAVSTALGTAHAADMTIDWGTWRTAIMISTGGTALIELRDDVMEWWTRRKADGVSTSPSAPSA